MNTKIKNQEKKTNMKKKKPVEKISFGESREHSQMIGIKISLKKRKTRNTIDLIHGQARLIHGLQNETHSIE